MMTLASRPVSLTAAFLLAVVLADVIGFGECRTLLEDHHQLQRNRRGSTQLDIDNDYVADGAATADDDDDPEAEAPSAGAGVQPAILTSPQAVDTAEGTTVNLPCKVTQGSLDDVALIWINGTKSIMTDTFPTSMDPRVKPGTPSEPSSGYSDNSLVIEQVTQWDSGLYTCKITSTPPVEVTHTLHVTHPVKILSIQNAGASGPFMSVAKKLVIKQGEPMQLVCNVVGYPTPSVQWTRRAKHHQQHGATAQSLGQEQIPPVAQPSSMLAPVVVSNTNEVRIESISAHQHAGYYECVAHNSVLSESTAARLGLDLEIEYQPEITVTRTVVNTGETSTAQMSCAVNSYPKPKVTWEKEQKSDGSSTWLPLVTDGLNSRFEAVKLTIAAAMANTAALNGSVAVPTGPTYVLKVKKVQGLQDFGKYRCKAENKLGITYSENITLTGTPAQPRSTYVNVKQLTANGDYKMPELGWAVDSGSPLLEYQLQYKKQQDSTWMAVRPQLQVTERPTDTNNAGDELKYTTSHTFGGDGQQQRTDVEPSSLEHGTTYVARLRARNIHGWSEWSSEVVFSGGMDDDQGDNEINHQHDVMKAAAGSSGASSLWRPPLSAAATTIVAIVSVASVFVAVDC